MNSTPIAPLHAGDNGKPGASVLPHPTPRKRQRSRHFLVLAGAAFLLGGCATVSPDAGPPPSTSAADPRPGPAAQTPTATTAASTRAPARIHPPASAGTPLSAIEVANTSLPAVVTLAAPTDLWERIRRGLSMPDLENDMVREREQWHAARPDYMQRMTERAEPYLFHIVEEIERRNLPMELALLPYIESSFNPQAVSHARAAGLWQFMPATGTSFDLTQNVFRDDRRDVLASTRAALDYLEQLYRRFGDWHLALAAYNWGQGSVSRAITRNQRAGLPTSYNYLNMPMETRMYVPRLQAVENIIANPQAFRMDLPLLGNHPFFETVSIERDMDVALIARLSGISEQDFRTLNPAIKHPLVLAAGTPDILLPWDNAADFQRNLLTHSGPLASWTAWVVPRTMTVAQAAERVGMSPADLRRINHIPPRMQVRAGSSLLVPRNAQRNADVPAHVADNGRLSLKPEVTLRSVTVRVRKGENLTRLARRFGVSPENAAKWNRLPVNANLRAGQTLTLMLPRRAAARAPTASGARPAKRQNATPNSRPRTAPRASVPPKPAAQTTQTSQTTRPQTARERAAAALASNARAQPQL